MTGQDQKGGTTRLRGWYRVLTKRSMTWRKIECMKTRSNIPVTPLAHPGESNAGRRLLDIKETSAYLGIQIDTIYRMVSERRIPFVKVGRRTMFDLRLIDDWLSKHTVMPMPRKVA
jgi:excisionase family DNA binding protein